MARRPNNEILYKTFQDFLKLCLMNNRSLLWPEKDIWTPQNIGEVKRRMVDSPILGHDLSFEDKLKEQMKDGPPELWAVLSDTYYIYFLPSTYITFEKKQKDIRSAAEKGGLQPPPLNSPIWEAQRSGFTRTTQKYHFKVGQFWFILLFANHIKGIADPELILNSPPQFQKHLDLIIESIPTKVLRPYDMRHAFLYLAFPDLYERIISTRDKERVVETYCKRVSRPVPEDLDEAIRKIREALSPQYDKPDRLFDFYQDLKEEWKPGKGIPAETIPVDTGTGLVTVPVSEEPTQDIPEKETEATEHTQIQWMLLKLGNDMGLDVWVAKNDRNREVAGHKFTDLPRLKKELPLTFDEATNRTILLIDVLWLKGNAIRAAFEIESTTSIYSGILRMADLIAMQPNINIPLYLVAPDERRERVIAEVNRPVFSKLSPPMSEICKFIPFSALREKVPQVSKMAKYMSPDFLEELSEPCEVEEEE